MIPEPRPGQLRPGLMLLASLVGLAAFAIPRLRKQRSAGPKKQAGQQAAPTSDPWLRRSAAPAPRKRALGAGQGSAEAKRTRAAGAPAPGRGSRPA